MLILMLHGGIRIVSVDVTQTITGPLRLLDLLSAMQNRIVSIIRIIKIYPTMNVNISRIPSWKMVPGILPGAGRIFLRNG